MMLLKTGLVIDADLLQVLIAILIIAAVLGFVYLIRIHIAYRMAKNRHREALGWVLLSLFISPLLTWIVLLIIGDDKRYEQH